MSVAIVTGSAGLIGSQAVRHFAALGLDVVGIDNDMRATFFGPQASTQATAWLLERDVPGYRHEHVDIRDPRALARIWRRYGKDVSLVVHAAAQPSHDWAARDPLTDWAVNATGTMKVLDVTRRHAPDAVLVHMSTNKVYGDRPNYIPTQELATRHEIVREEITGPLFVDGVRWAGIHEGMPIDDCLHSVFGASKVAADVMAQEYGRYFGLKTVVFRGGCLTGPAHAAAELHGFLAYLVRQVARGETYRVIGYGGRQVRDIIHAADVVAAFGEVFDAPPEPGTVYNLGGGRGNSVSVLEALTLAAQVTGRDPVVQHVDEPRRGDHRWYITDMAKFTTDYPQWAMTYDLPAIVGEIAASVAVAA